MAIEVGGLLDLALPDVVLEMDYNYTTSVEEGRDTLPQLGGVCSYCGMVAAPHCH